MESVINFVSLAILSTALAIGQVMFKRVGLAIRGQPPVDGLVSLLAKPAFYIVLIIYGFSTLLWVWILSRMPLSQAYPWVAVGMAIVPLLGWYVFGEQVRSLFWLGIVLIFIGIIITQYACQSN